MEETEFVVQLRKVDGNTIVDLYEIPQVFVPMIRLFVAPWYDPDDDRGKLAVMAMNTLHVIRERIEEIDPE